MEEKKIRLNVALKKKYVDQLKEKEINISQLLEEAVKKLLKE